MKVSGSLLVKGVSVKVVEIRRKPKEVILKDQEGKLYSLKQGDTLALDVTLDVLSNVEHSVPQ